jgi:hypothetical protein
MRALAPACVYTKTKRRRHKTLGWVRTCGAAGCTPTKRQLAAALQRIHKSTEALSLVSVADFF